MNQIATLNQLRATIIVAEFNAKARHICVSGPSFRSLHLLFDDIYKTLDKAADKIGETVRVLGGEPETSLGEFSSHSIISYDVECNSGAEDMVEYMRREIRTIIQFINDGASEEEFDPTTENDLLAISSELRHWLLFLDGYVSEWAKA